MRTHDFRPLPERITFTVDVEDHVGTAGDRPRYVAMTRRVLDFLAERQAVGTHQSENLLRGLEASARRGAAIPMASGVAIHG